MRALAVDAQFAQRFGEFEIHEAPAVRRPGGLAFHRWAPLLLQGWRGCGSGPWVSQCRCLAPSSAGWSTQRMCDFASKSSCDLDVTPDWRC